MSLFRWFGLVRDAASGSPSAPGADAGHAPYHRRIVAAGCLTAALGALVGVLVSVSQVGEVGSPGDVKALFVVPVAFTLGGFMFGAAVACLFAPRAFLTGPVGRPWMKLIGTESVAKARVACFLFGLLITAAAVGTGIMMMRTPGQP